MHEPSFGNVDNIADANSVMPASLAGPGTRHYSRNRKQKSNWFRLLVIVALIAVAGYGVRFGYLIYLGSHVSLDRLDSQESSLSSTSNDYVKPLFGQDEPLTNAQVHWCLRQKLRISVLRELVSTLEVSRINVIEQDYIVRCDLSKIDKQMLDAAQDFVELNRNAIISEISETQLLFLDEKIQASDGNSELVYSIQQLLDTLGYEVGSIDGIYGAKTQSAIKAFEQNAGLPTNGKASQEILAALRRATTEHNRP